MKAPEESWRLFIAVELPLSIRQKVRSHIDHLRQAVPDAQASWTREENLHLTLKFLGDTPVTKVEALAQAIQNAAIRVSPFGIVVGGCGAFPPHGHPRVLWIGIDDPSGRLALLHQGLEAECDQAGLTREERPFHPHLTIARLRKPQGSRHLAQTHRELGFDGETVVVSDLALIKSELRSEGSRHTVVVRHALSSK